MFHDPMMADVSHLQALGDRGQGHIRQLPQVHVARDVVAQLHTDASRRTTTRGDKTGQTNGKKRVKTG